VTSSCYKEITLTNEYQCYHSLNEKLPDQPNKSFFFAEIIVLLAKLSQFVV